MATYNKEQLAELCDLEGTAYAIQNYINIDDIEDAELRDLARDAKKALDRLDDALGLG